MKCSEIKKAGITKYNTITLKRGMYIPNKLYDWEKVCQHKEVNRCDMIISLLNEERETVAKWKAAQAWPVKFVCSELMSTGSEVAIESIEVAHEGLTIED